MLLPVSASLLPPVVSEVEQVFRPLFQVYVAFLGDEFPEFWIRADLLSVGV